MRRWLKWMLAFCWLLFAVALALSLSSWAPGWYGETWIVELDNSSLDIEWHVDPQWIFGEGGFVYGPPHNPPRLWPSFETWPDEGGMWTMGRDGRTIVLMPLWLPLVLVGATTGWLFWRDRPHGRKGHCQSCGYNLTGNVSGKCPECGTEVKPAV